MRPKRQTASIVVKLRKNRVNQFGAYPIIIRLAKDNEEAMRSIGFDCYEWEWDEKKQLPLKEHPKYFKLKKVIDEIVDRIENKEMEFHKKNERYSIHDLTPLISKAQEKYLVFERWEEIIKQMKKDGEIGNADVYLNTKRVVENFADNPELQFHQINYTFLSSMLSYCKQRNNKDTTMFCYFKTLRAFLYRCIKLEYCEPSDFGFKKFSLADFNLKTKKRAISLERIKAIEELELKPYSAQWNARNYFLFGFYTRGTNMIDIAKLNTSNIIDGRLEFVRTKTGDDISLKLHDRALEIINYYKGRCYKDLLFPIYKNDEEYDCIKDERRYPTVIQKVKVNSTTRTVSRRLEFVAKKVGMGVKLTHYVGRHSYASGLRKSGVGTLAIKEALHHKDEKTTETYLKDLGNEEIDEFDNVLFAKMNNITTKAPQQ